MKRREKRWKLEVKMQKYINKTNQEKKKKQVMLKKKKKKLQERLRKKKIEKNIPQHC